MRTVRLIGLSRQFDDKPNCVEDQGEQLEQDARVLLLVIGDFLTTSRSYGCSMRSQWSSARARTSTLALLCMVSLYI